jgi:uncharacterized protein (TIGR00255 family)
MPLENQIKKRVASVLKRGKIDVFITQETTSQSISEPVVNEALVEAYVRLFRQLIGKYDLEGGVPLGLLATQKDVLQLQEVNVAEQDLASCLMPALDAALQAVVGMREKEGEATRVDIVQRFDLLLGLIEQIVERAPQVPAEWQQKLKERLTRLGDEAGDPQRVAQEIAVFADRCDISEEITRFNSHLEQFRELLQQAEPVGRQMDFLVQELNREANTMGSKSNDAELTRLVVLLKSELEKIREQVQNVE